MVGVNLRSSSTPRDWEKFLAKAEENHLEISGPWDCRVSADEVR